MLRKLLFVAALSGIAGPAAAQVDLVGDIDCFGNPGSVASCDGTFWSTSATGSDPLFTDRQHSSGGPAWTHNIAVGPFQSLVSATLQFRQQGMGTCCGSSTNVFVNGFLAGSIGNQNPASTETFALDVSWLNDGANPVSISLASGDIWAMDYSQLTYQVEEIGPTVPEPFTVVTLASGLLGIGFVQHRRRRRQRED